MTSSARNVRERSWLFIFASQIPGKSTSHRVTVPFFRTSKIVVCGVQAHIQTVSTTRPVYCTWPPAKRRLMEHVAVGFDLFTRNMYMLAVAAGTAAAAVGKLLF